MRTKNTLMALFLASGCGLSFAAAAAHTDVSIGINIGPPPAPAVVAPPPAPQPGYVWGPGYWSWAFNYPQILYSKEEFIGLACTFSWNVRYRYSVCIVDGVLDGGIGSM